MCFTLITQDYFLSSASMHHPHTSCTNLQTREWVSKHHPPFIHAFIYIRTHCTTTMPWLGVQTEQIILDRPSIRMNSDCIRSVKLSIQNFSQISESEPDSLSQTNTTEKAILDILSQTVPQNPSIL